jgi:hypothetical protein
VLLPGWQHLDFHEKMTDKAADYDNNKVWSKMEK